MSSPISLLTDDPATFQLESFTDGDILQAFASLLHTTFFDYDWSESLNLEDEEESEDNATKPRDSPKTNTVTHLEDSDDDNSGA